MTPNSPLDTGNLVLQAVRELLTAFPMPGTGDPSKPPEGSALSQLMQEPTAMTQYQSLAMLAAIIRWAAHETARTEEELVDELSKNYSGPAT